MTKHTAESAPDALPYGDYLVREAEAPEGYLGADAEVPFSIEKDGEMVELTGEGELPGATLRAYDADALPALYGCADVQEVAGERPAVPLEVAHDPAGSGVPAYRFDDSHLSPPL